MRCEDLRNLIEPIVAGDVVPTDDAAAHVASCAACAADLALARRIDRLLASREFPAAPASFAAAVMRRVRQERWRAEQYLDLGFNAAIIVSVALVIGGIWLALNLTGLAAVTSGTVAVFSTGLHELLQRAAPRLPIYVGAAMLMLTAFAVWWWAERGWSV
jgi:anti-sigma factor RsiW